MIDIGALVLSLVGLAQATSAQAVTLTIADYQDDYAPLTPATGWSYLWNANGGVGSASSYSPLIWNGAGYTNNGASLPGAGDNYASLSATGGHPGPGTSNSGGFFAPFDRYVLAA